MEPIIITPIGFVRNKLGRRSFDKWRDTESEIILREEYQEALFRLDEFSHIEVIFYLNEMDEKFKLKIHPTGDPEYPLIGAFATRTPNRPSRIALSTCKLIEINENILIVKGLDAYDGSPVIDIKPYTEKIIKDLKVPQWIYDLRKKNSCARGSTYYS
jgi:tRNA-Thr(GGU) m(6)t(6)A37 methyltransferase TsaA